jgi:hypothetical protein
MLSDWYFHSKHMGLKDPSLRSKTYDETEVGTRKRSKEGFIIAAEL